MKTIIFDMDGTLVNSGEIITSSINYVREQIGLDTLKHHYILEKINEKDTSIPMFCYGSKNYTKEVEKLFNEYFHNNFKKSIKLYNGIESLLLRLSEDYKLAIATNAHQETALLCLSHLNIDKYFDIIVGSDMVAFPKPEPDMIEFILNKFNTSKQDTIFVGDSYKDKFASNAGGVDYIMVDWGFSEYAKYDDCLVNSSFDLEKTIRHIKKG